MAIDRGRPYRSLDEEPLGVSKLTGDTSRTLGDGVTKPDSCQSQAQENLTHSLTCVLIAGLLPKRGT